jgi:NAD(P)H-hydrate epimerase
VRDTHKGHYGRVLAIGGAAGLAGAPALAALGALRAGAGLVTAAVPHEGLPVMWSLAPEAMSHGLAAPAGCLQLDALRRWGRDPAAFDAVLAGPGMTAGQHTIGIVSWLLAGGAPRLLLDADGLNALAGWAAPGARPPVAWSSRPPGSLVLTPHPGEAARLLACSVAAVQADRAAAARQLADCTGGVVVLKGCGTVVCGPGGTPRLNLTGNPGMASGGMGDVLAGVIAALWSRGLTALDAACLGVYLHGTAGDLAAWERSEEALLARDVADRLGDAFGTLEPAAERVPLPAAPDATR